MKVTITGCEGSYWGDENVSNWIVGNGCTSFRGTEISFSLMIKQIKWVSCMVCKLYLSPAFEK